MLMSDHIFFQGGGNCPSPFPHLRTHMLYVAITIITSRGGCMERRSIVYLLLPLQLQMHFDCSEMHYTAGHLYLSFSLIGFYCSRI